MAANLTTTYASQILDLLGLSKFKGGGGNASPPAPPPDKNIPGGALHGWGYRVGVLYMGGGRVGVGATQPLWISIQIYNVHK